MQPVDKLTLNISHYTILKEDILSIVKVLKKPLPNLQLIFENVEYADHLRSFLPGLLRNDL